MDWVSIAVFVVLIVVIIAMIVGYQFNRKFLQSYASSSRARVINGNVLEFATGDFNLRCFESSDFEGPGHTFSLEADLVSAKRLQISDKSLLFLGPRYKKVIIEHSTFPQRLRVHSNDANWAKHVINQEVVNILSTLKSKIILNCALSNHGFQLELVDPKYDLNWDEAVDFGRRFFGALYRRMGAECQKTDFKSLSKKKLLKLPLYILVSVVIIITVIVACAIIIMLFVP